MKDSMAGRDCDGKRTRTAAVRRPLQIASLSELVWVIASTRRDHGLVLLLHLSLPSQATTYPSMPYKSYAEIYRAYRASKRSPTNIFSVLAMRSKAVITELCYEAGLRRSLYMVEACEHFHLHCGLAADAVTPSKTSMPKL